MLIESGKQNPEGDSPVSLVIWSPDYCFLTDLKNGKPILWLNSFSVKKRLDKIVFYKSHNWEICTVTAAKAIAKMEISIHRKKITKKYKSKIQTRENSKNCINKNSAVLDVRTFHQYLSASQWRTLPLTVVLVQDPDEWTQHCFVSMLSLSIRCLWSCSAQRGRVTYTPSRIPTSRYAREEPSTCSCWPPPSHWARCETSSCCTTTPEVAHHGTRGLIEQT